MSSPARLNQVQLTIQEYPLIIPCPCQARWDDDHKRLPSPHLPDGDERFYAEKGVPLYKAALNGDREEMQRILSEINNETILCSSLTEAYETALHVAVEVEKAATVRELVERMDPEDLVLQDAIGNTPFCMAVATGNVEIAKILMEKRDDVTLIRGANKKTPLHIAAVAGHPEMVRFVYENFHQHYNHLNDDELREIFFASIRASLFELAIEMLKVHTNLAWARNDDKETGLGILAEMPLAFAGKSSTRPRRLVDYLCCGLNTIPMQDEALELTKRLCKTISDEQIKFFDRNGENLMFKAAKLGNDKFLSVLIGCYPDLIFKKNKDEGSTFHIAVLHRHASIFKLIHNLGLQRNAILRYKFNYKLDGIDTIRCNILHLAAKLPSSDRLSIVSGPALQMQRELLWLKEVENLLPPSFGVMRGSKDNLTPRKLSLTPRELFTKEHESLRKTGEEWMRSTAQSGMIVATLITTVAFTTASTLPGGNKENNGSPVDIGKVMFHVFMVSDAVAMCSSIISTLMFLSILTSRYAEEDFLLRLPMKLLAGSTALLLSMMAVLVSFATMFFLAYEKENLISAHKTKWTWVPGLATAMSTLPVVLFVVLEYKLLRDVFWSTFGSKFLFRPKKSTF